MSLKHRVVSIILFSMSILLTHTASAEMRGWGLRVGIADDPDGIIGGVHFNMGEISKNLRFQPNIELGVGDDRTTLFGTGALHYRFNMKKSFTPYAGGGLALGVVDTDRGNAGDDTEFEIELRAVGGVEWQLEQSNAFFLELQLGFGDVYDTRLTAGWEF